MSQPWVAGPVPVFVGLGNGFSPLYFGFSERGVSINFDPEYSPYVVDFAGSVPLDYAYQGCSCTINLSMTSWRENVYALMADYAGVIPGSVRGSENFGEIGTLMGFELAAFPVWLAFPYQGKLAYSAGVAGYHFYKCFIDRDSLPERGSRPGKLDITLRAVRAVGATSLDGRIGSTFLGLYDHDMTAVAGLIFNINANE